MKTLVVARFEEDVSWYKRVPPDWKVMEVQKGREIENYGREVSSFLWAILRLYPSLEPTDLVAFVQGDPFDHCPDIDPFLLLDRSTDGFRALGDYTYVSNGDGFPHHQGIPVAECYEEWLGEEFPGSIRFAPGGQFVVNGADIKKHKPEFYERLLKEMDDDLKPWCMERIWPALFPPQRPQELQATFYCQATPATTYVRCELPARYLPGKVSATPVLFQSKDDYTIGDHDGAAIFQFAGDKYRALMVHAFQSKGIPCFIESDDNYFTSAPTMHKTGWEKQIGQGAHTIEGHKAILKWVDGAIVTTEHLAKQYRKVVKNVHVCPNTIDPLDWPTLKKRDDGILRIGWGASSSHAEDSKLVARAMEWASQQKDVEVVTIGLDPTWWKFRRKQIEWQDMPGFREALHELDIAIAPVIGTPWALCRSDLKALEGGMAGAAMIVSDVAPYDPWTDGENCLKAKTPKDFLRLIQHFVKNRDEVKQLGEAARKYVLRDRTTVRQVQAWRDALNSVEAK